jgi:hypothetical protein
MRKLALILIVAAFLLTGCHVGRMHDGITGSGVRKREKRDLSPFTSITTDGAFDVQVVSQQPQSLEIEGDDNLLALVATDVSNGVLRIKNLRGYSTNDPVKIKISIPNIDGVTANGAGTIEISGVKNDKLEINSNGAPTIKVSGETKALAIDANGAGKIDAHKLHAENAEVEAKGVARVEVFASDQLNVTVSGPSTVIYDGDPNLNQTINGPGSIKKRESGGA